ncbi:MAG TPA: hypothetical protein VK864_21310, partial [Longimicrobiales bacterium]|nr:hypothetical protein [Longimicrobiales bacterium]
VRARLTGEAAARRSQGLDEPIVRLDGTIVESSSQVLALDVLVARTSSAFQDVVIRDTVRLETTEIQSVLQRKLSVGRTALVVLGAGAAAAGIVLGIDQIVGGTDEPPDGGDPNLRARRIVIPLFRFR